MNQSSRTLLMLLAVAAVAAGLGFYAWKGVYEGDEKESKRKDVDERLFSVLKVDEKGADGAVAAIDFVKLKLTAADGGVSVLEREPGSAWKMTAPVSADVDKIAVDQITSQLQSSKFKYVADEQPDEAALEKYGLKTPSFVVEAEAVVGNGRDRRSVKLVGGAENSFNGSIFVLRNDEKKVWGAEGGVKWTFSKSPFELREKEVVALDEPKVSAIEVKTKNNAYALSRDADKAWVLKPATVKKGQDTTFPADNGAIVGAINGLKSERALSFPQAGEATGLDAPFEDLTFTTESGPVHVKLAKAGDKVFMQRDDAHGSIVAQVKEAALGHFDRNPYDLRDRSAAPFRREAVAKVVFHPAEGPDIVVEKEASDAGTAELWRVTAPSQGPAKQFRIAAVLWSLGTIKAGDPVEEHPKDLKKYGLDKPVSVAVSDASGRELARLAIGSDVPGKQGQKYVIGTKGGVVTSDVSRLNELPTKLGDVLDEQRPAFDAGH